MFHNPVCQGFVTAHNVQSTKARTIAFKSRRNHSSHSTSTMAWVASADTPRPASRHLVNPNDAWLQFDAASNETALSEDDSTVDQQDTFSNAGSASDRDTDTDTEDEDAAPPADPTDNHTSHHADPYAWRDTRDDTTSVSLETRCMVKLLKLLEDMECPDYALAKVVDWAHDSYRQGFKFAPCRKSRDGVLAGLYTHVHNAELLLPSVIPVVLIGSPVPIDMIVYDFASTFLAMFHSKSLMQAHKVNINPQDPFAPYDPPGGLLGELHSGAMATAMREQYITDPSKQLFCPTMFYFDYCHVTNASSRFGLEPATMTSSFFTETARRLPEAHRVLGFMHQVIKSAAENSKQNGSTNQKNYHRQLEVLFRGLRQVQRGADKRLQDVEITIYDKIHGDVTFRADLVVPIIIVIADTPAANKLCGHFASHNPGIERQHHMCDVGVAALADPTHYCTFIDAQTVFETQATGTNQERQVLSVKQVDNAFRHLDVLLDHSSIFRATATETMHSLRQGILRRTNGLLFQCMAPSQQAVLDQMSRRFNLEHRQTVRLLFPRASFVKGITTLSKISAEEQVGVTMTIICLMQQEEGWQLMSDALKPEALNPGDVLQLLECLLVFDAWTRQPTFWCIGDDAAAKRVDASIRVLMTMVQERLPRDKGNGWLIPTFHSLKHLVREITDFGSPMGFCAERPECNHSVFAKRPGRRAQKRYATYERQVATRISDATVLDHCHRTMFPALYYDHPISVDDTMRTRGTRWTITAQGACAPPIVHWHTRTSVQHMRWPDGLAQFALTHYGTNELHGCTEVTAGADNIRCHPRYRRGSPWYEWVMIEDSDNPEHVPAKLWTVVSPTSTTVEFIATIARIRTERDSVLFTEWKYEQHFEIVTPEQLRRPVFVVKAKTGAVCTMCAQDKWSTHFTDMSRTPNAGDNE